MRARPRQRTQRPYAHAFGPGFVTGASDDDPSGVGTYAQAGAQFGYALLWTALITLPLMAAVQEISDRTALATGEGLGELASRAFGRAGRAVLTVLLVALLAANTLNVGADAVAVGSGMHLLHAGPSALWALGAGGAVTAMLATGSFDAIASVFKVLAAVLVSYVIVLFLSHPDWGMMATKTFVPDIRWSKDYVALFVAVLGTTISLYLFFWQSAHRLEEMREEPGGGPHRAVPLGRRSHAAAQRKERTSRLDVFTGMFFSNLVMYAIIAATAATLGAHGTHDIASAADAARALQPVAGRFAGTVFAVGFIGSGMLAIPVLAGSASVGLADLFGRDWGFSRRVSQAPVFYGLVFGGTLCGTVLSAIHLDPIKLLVSVAVINGLASAPFLLVVMIIANRADLMGEFRNRLVANVLGWLTVFLMAGAAVAFFLSGGAAGL